MASLQPPATMENLPCDVLSNIFIRLLAKQLAQMRSVSKSWNSLLSQPSFIKSHLHRSLHDNDEILLLFYEVFDDFTQPFSVHPSTSLNLKLVDFIKPPVNFQWENACAIGSVNGLICFNNRSFNDNDDVNNDCVIHIWNPSLSALLTLPPHFVPSPFNHLFRVTFRFGFDPKADDYKVVKLPSLLRTYCFPALTWVDFCNLAVKEWLQVEVYSMRKGSWKLITQTFPSHITGISREDDVCVDGHDGLLHWLGYIGEEMNGQMIVVFDLGAETFHEITLPDSTLHHNVSKRFNVLGHLAGKLCLMSYVKDGEFEVWVMDEYGVVESWVKRHAFSQFRNIFPFGFTLRNEFLFQDRKIVRDDDDDDYCYGSYDLVAAKTKVFKLCVHISKIVGYVDSLVWVAPGEHEQS